MFLYLLLDKSRDESKHIAKQVVIEVLVNGQKEMHENILYLISCKSNSSFDLVIIFEPG